MNDGTQNSREAAMSDNRTRVSLLVRVRDFGNQQNWEEFEEVYGLIILRHLLRIGVSQDHALELVQGCCLS